MKSQSSAAPSTPDPKILQEVTAELQQLGMINPAARDRLQEDLRQSDPVIWPLVLQQFRATEAYRRRAIAKRQDAERLPPIAEVSVAADESPQEPPSIPEIVVETTPSQVVQASYPAPVTGSRRQRLAAAKEELEKLSEPLPLAVRNLAFCTEIQSYGCTKRFEKYEFQPNEATLLYAEVENFVSEPTPEGYHTSLKSSYRIFDTHGQCVADHGFVATEEYCQNPRRDFFIGYRLRLPEDIGPGKYRLYLSIEDLNCQKTGQAEIEFEIVKAEGGRE